MRKILLLTMLLLGPRAVSFSQVYTGEEEKGLRVIDSLVEAREYDAALPRIAALDMRRPLPVSTLRNCALCYMLLKEYRKCIDFCDSWLAAHPDDTYLFFNAFRGICYYCLSEIDKSFEQLRTYVNEIEEQNLEIDEQVNGDIGLYACVLFESNYYMLADTYFGKYFENVQKAESLSPGDLHKSAVAENYAPRLYYYAYCRFFLGDEEKGFQLLQYAGQCGSSSARADILQLGKCRTFNAGVQLSKSDARKIDGMLSRLDVYSDFAGFSSGEFWEYVKARNASYQEIYAAMTKGSTPKTLRKALAEIGDGKASMDRQLAESSPYAVSDVEKRILKRLTGEEASGLDLRVYPAKNVNAFATPYGSIYLTSGLVERYHLNTAMLLAVCAHEMAHYTCWHSAASIWKQKKRERSNNMWAGIAVGLNSIAQGAVAMYGASNGVKYEQSYWDGVTRTNNDLLESFRRDTYYFKFKYSREQETEADIIAYRFCEETGIGGYAYIMALQLLSDGDEYFDAGKEADHPSTLYRICLLKRLWEREHGLPPA